MRDRSIEDEINAIRLRIHERTKDMTTEEHTEYYRKSFEETAKIYGLKSVPPLYKKVDTP